jgi:hypothetical protein
VNTWIVTDTPECVIPLGFNWVFVGWASNHGLLLVVAKRRLFGICGQGSDIGFQGGCTHGFLKQLTGTTTIKLAQLTQLLVLNRSLCQVNTASRAYSAEFRPSNFP